MLILMVIELAALVEIGAPLAPLASKLAVPIGSKGASLGMRRFRSWQRAVVKDVVKAADFPVPKRSLRKLLSEPKTLTALTPVDEDAATSSVELFATRLRGSRAWRDVPAEDVNERAANVVHLVQSNLLAKLDAAPALAIAEKRFVKRDATTHDLLRNVVTATGAARDLPAMASQLPPHTAAELAEAAAADAPRLPELARLMTSSEDPARELSAWLSEPPSWFEDGPATNWTHLASALSAYGLTLEAGEALRRAITAGVADRSYWRARAALFFFNADQRSVAQELVADLDHPLALTVQAMVEEDWGAARDAAVRWQPDRPRDKELQTLLQASATAVTGPEDAAIDLLDGRLVECPGAAAPMLLARMLTRRAQLGRSISRDADLDRATDLALQARDRRRAFRGDSVEALLIAADSRALVSR